MPPEIKQFNCPQCGSPLDLKNAGKSKSVICPACHSQIDLTGTDYQVVGNVGTRRTPEMTPFEIGTRGTVAGEEHAIIGRVRYRDDEDAWDEWLLLSASGDYRWISEDEDEGMVLWHSFTPTQPVDPNTVHQGATIDLGEGPARVRERGSARIDYLEGELTWKARVGDTMEYIDAEGASQLYSIEWTTDEIEFWRGQRVQAREVATAFGISPSAAVGSPKLAVSGISALIGLVICIVAACVVVAAVGSGSGQAMELVCNTPTPSSVGAVPTPTIVAAKVTPSVTPTEDLSADDTSDEEPTATPPPNCYYRPVSGGSGISGIFGSIRSGSSGRSTSGSGK